MKVYVAGPMTGIPQFNFPAFDDMAAKLRKLGHEVRSPAEMDDPTTRAAALASPDGAPGSGSANGETWGDFLARDVKLLADAGIQGVVVLPGWHRSRGARLETFVAHALCGIPVLTYEWTGRWQDTPYLKPVPKIELFRGWCAEPELAIHASFIGDTIDEQLTRSRA